MSELIDGLHLGNDRVIGSYWVDGVIVDPGPSTCLDALLGGLDGAEPRALLLTHIHLDHAGASGLLVRRFPDLKVYVHERGAPHVIDPSKLLASASRLYGDRMEELWGEVVPVPEENVVVLEGGETVEGMRVAYTPGHAWHHVSYFDESSGEVYTGDVGGVTIPPADFPLPPTPPPDINLEAWSDSLDVIAEWKPDKLCITHFGYHGDVETRIDHLREALIRFAELARRHGVEAFSAAAVEEIRLRAGGDETVVDRFVQASPPDQLYAGLSRYWTKRAESGGA